jgi:hypothetical protein
LAVGAVAVHQLRFVFGYGHGARDALALQGHSYLPLAQALIAVILAGSCAWFAGQVVLARRGRAIDSSGLGLGRLWASASVALIAVYTLQEWFEGEFSAGHPSGLVGIFGHGGWTAIPLALAFGAVIALLLEGARRVIVHASRRKSVAVRLRPRRGRSPRLPAGFPQLSTVAHEMAPRAPPTAA